MKGKLHAKRQEYVNALEKEREKMQRLQRTQQAIAQNIERLNGAIGAIDELMEAMNEDDFRILETGQVEEAEADAN